MKKFFKKRQKSRKLLLQGLYAWEINKNSIEKIKNQILQKRNKNKIDIKYLTTLLINISKKKKILNFIMKNNLKKKKKIGIIKKKIITIAIFEFFFYKKIPPKVIINESLELSKIFCIKNSYTLINKVLNDIMKNFIHNKNFLL